MTMAAIFCFLKEKKYWDIHVLHFGKQMHTNNQSGRGIPMLDPFIVLNVLWHVKLYRVEKNLYNG